ncbi:MAG TPA: hypothetical protein VMX13_10665 [Sedimentisphaerales bacterium]|nr:hypothetical protein [Sedimentisphaerales bacterium]
MKKLWSVTEITLLSMVVFAAQHGENEKTEREPLWPNKVWGEAFKQAALSVSPMKEKYKPGEKIEISVVVKNLADKELVLTYDGRPKRRIALFDEEGQPVEKTETGKEADKYFSNGSNNPFAIYSARVQRVPPGGTFPGPTGWHLLTLNHWFKLDKSGTFTLVMMQQISLEDTDFLISNAAHINITE